MSARDIEVGELVEELEQAPQKHAIIMVKGSTMDGWEFEVPIRHVRVGLNKITLEVGEV